MIADGLAPRARQKRLERHGDSDTSGENERLRADADEHCECEQDKELAADSRPLQHQREAKRERRERGQEEGLGQRERRVCHPRLEHYESGEAETPALGQDASREGVRRNGGQRHNDCVHRFHRGERRSAITRESVSRTEEERVENAVPDLEVAAQ